MKRENNRTNWILRLACVLFCLTMLTTCLTGGLFARYTATFEGSDSARVARFVFDVADKTNRYVDLTEITEPGDSEQYVFVVTNTDGNVSEVEQTYQIANPQDHAKNRADRR